MITHDDLQKLMDHAATEGRHVLSVYLNVDQGRADNLNREYRVPLHNMLRDLECGIGDVGEREAFKACAARVRQYVESYRPAGRTLALFTDPPGGLFWARDFRMPIESQVRWLPRPFVRPFLEARDEHPRYVVALTDRGKTRLLSVCMGEIEQDATLVAEEDVRHFDASGKDQTRSQMRFQRNAEEHAKHHLKKVVAALKDLDKTVPFDRLILGGPSRTVAELERLLSEPLRHRVVSAVTLPVEADRKTVLEETLRVDEEFEHRTEMSLTEALLTAAAKNRMATAGVAGTVRAALEGRVRTLVYPRDFAVFAKDCPTVPANGGGGMPLTEFLGEPIKPEDNLLDLLVENTAREGAKVEVLHGEAGLRLKEAADGLGAFLRY